VSLFRRPPPPEVPRPEEPIVEGERGIASVNRAASLQSRVSSVLAVGLMSVLGVGLLTWYYAHTYARRGAVRQSAEAATKSRAQGDMPLPSLGPIAAPSLLGPAPAPPLQPQTLTEIPVDAASPAMAGPSAPAGGPQVKSPAELELDRRLSGPSFVGRDAAKITTVAESGDPEVVTATRAGEGGRAAPAALSGGGDGAFSNLLRPSVTPAVHAQVLPTQRLLLPKGAFIDCTLETAVDSTLPGMTTCITATDTFSADGTVVLLERGTKLVGETRGEVAQGTARLFVLWTEARTPTGIVVPLASPGTDELGRAGLAGDVNRHFWQRFGAAILISVINGAVQAGIQSSSSSGAVIVNPSATSDVLTEVLKGTVNIPPTVTVQNGARIQVLVARDLDFRSVYELRPIAGR
jgi:type IV secretion system protein VirB10